MAPIARTTRSPQRKGSKSSIENAKSFTVSSAFCASSVSLEAGAGAGAAASSGISRATDKAEKVLVAGTIKVLIGAATFWENPVDSSTTWEAGSRICEAEVCKMKLLPKKSDTPSMIGAPTVSVTLVRPTLRELWALFGMLVAAALLVTALPRCDLSLGLSLPAGTDGLI